MTRPAPKARTDYPHFMPIQTRWADNDIYGHVNNVVYYSYFDTVVNAYLINAGALDIHNGETIGLVVETNCRYFAPIEFPQNLEGGVRVAHMGNSSVRYEIGIFVAGEDAPAAEGYFVHVYVDRQTRKAEPLPEPLRRALAPILI